jgi:hypothetical protein
MDNEEILRRQEEGIKLRREVGDLEYRKIKARRQRERYDKMQEIGKEVLGEKYTPGLSSAIGPTPQIKKEKPRGTMVGIMVVDDSGEHVFMWNAPHLRGTMMASKQNLNGYKEAVFDAFQKAFGKLTENK